MGSKKKLPKKIREWFKAQGSKGGTKRAANMTAEQRKEAAKNAVAAREKKRKRGKA
jgi:hypothetical protein